MSFTKKRKNKKTKAKRATMVAVSALALSVSCWSPAEAQLQLTCSKQLDIGEHDACGTGWLVISPTGATAPAGCLISVAAPRPGRCTLSVFGPPPSKSVIVSFTGTSMTINSGAPTAPVKKLLLQPTASATAKKTFTFTPTEVANTVVMDVGGRLYFTAGQTVGYYTGTVNLTADLVP